MILIWKTLRIIGTVIFFILGGGLVITLCAWGVMMTISVGAYLFLRSFITGEPI